MLNLLKRKKLTVPDLTDIREVGRFLDQRDIRRSEYRELIRNMTNKQLIRLIEDIEDIRDSLPIYDIRRSWCDSAIRDVRLLCN